MGKESDTNSTVQETKEKVVKSTAEKGGEFTSGTISEKEEDKDSSLALLQSSKKEVRAENLEQIGTETTTAEQKGKRDDSKSSISEIKSIIVDTMSTKLTTKEEAKQSSQTQGIEEIPSLPDHSNQKHTQSHSEEQGKEA